MGDTWVTASLYTVLGVYNQYMEHFSYCRYIWNTICGDIKFCSERKTLKNKWWSNADRSRHVSPRWININWKKNKPSFACRLISTQVIYIKLTQYFLYLRECTIPQFLTLTSTYQGDRVQVPDIRLRKMCHVLYIQWLYRHSAGSLVLRYNCTVSGDKVMLWVCNLF